MHKKLDPLRCDSCGRFVSLVDLAADRACRFLVTPDSDYSVEEYETLCPICYIEERGDSGDNCA